MTSCLAECTLDQHCWLPTGDTEHATRGAYKATLGAGPARGVSALEPCFVKSEKCKMGHVLPMCGGSVCLPIGGGSLGGLAPDVV